MKLTFPLCVIVGNFVPFVHAFSPTALNQRNYMQKHVARHINSNQSYIHGGRISIVLFAGKVGIFFGTSTGNTQRVADLISEEFGDDAEGPFDIDSVQGSVVKKFSEFDALIVGTPTWNTGADTERSGTGWDEIYYGEMKGKLQFYFEVAVSASGGVAIMIVTQL